MERDGVRNRFRCQDCSCCFKVGEQNVGLLAIVKMKAQSQVDSIFERFTQRPAVQCVALRQ